MQVVSKQYAWVRVDGLSAVLYPIIMVGAFTALGDLAVSARILNGWYSSPYVVLCAVAANRICVRAGVWCAVLSILAHAYVFVGERWAWEWPPIEQALSYASMVAVPYIVGRKEKIITPRDGNESGDPAVGVQALPFTRDGEGDGESRHFWYVDASGDWGDDSHLGSEYGRIYLEHVRRSRRGPLLAWIISDMVRKGKWSGVEVGFLSVIGRAAAAPVSTDVRHLPASRPKNHADNC